MTEATEREVCGYLLVRGSVHAHAYALVLKKLTGVAIEKMLPVPNINLDTIPECQKYLEEGRHRFLYTNSPEDYKEMTGIWGNGEQALPGDPPGQLEVVEGVPDGAKIAGLNGLASAFAPQRAIEPNTTSAIARTWISADSINREPIAGRCPRLDRLWCNP
jgi:Mn-containing catalase